MCRCCVLNGPLCLTHYTHACIDAIRTISENILVTVNADISVKSLKAARKISL